MPENKNHSPDKNVLKNTAAVTLLLSTVACTFSEASSFFLNNICLIVPAFYLGTIGLLELHRRYYYNHSLPPQENYQKRHNNDLDRMTD